MSESKFNFIPKTTDNYRKDLPRPDDFAPNNGLRVIGWTRMGIMDHVEFMKRRWNASELRQLSKWCITCAEWIENNAKPARPIDPPQLSGQFQGQEAPGQSAALLADNPGQ